MSGSIATTFKTLSASANAHAVDVLVTALDVDDERMRNAAVSSLLSRRSLRGVVEVVRRLEALSEASYSELISQPSRISPALKQALLHGDDAQRRCALRLTEELGDFEQIGPLLELLAGDRGDLHERVLDVVTGLVNRLYDQGRHRHHSGEGYVANAAALRQSVLTHLDHDVSKGEHPYLRELIEFILILGDPDSGAVRKVMSQSSAEARRLAELVLMEGTHPGAMQLVLDSMSKNYPHAIAFRAIGERHDAEFICHMLRWFPEHLTDAQLRNLQQIRDVSWLRGSRLSLDFVPPALQPPLVRLVSALGLPADVKTAVEEWLVRYGSLEGRLAATEVLSVLDQNEVKNIIYTSLADDDEEVQAWATSQLRSQHVPQALTLLLERLDSPLESVREAARKELGSFNLQYMFELYDHLSPEVCLRGGRLIQRLQPDCIDVLTAELTGPIRNRRIRAVRCALAMGLHPQIVEPLLAMLADADQLVRRCAIEVLGHVASPKVEAALTALLDDPSPRVRADASKALEGVHRPVAETTVG